MKPIQIHIPKTGGLSVRKVLGEEGLPPGHHRLNSPRIQSQLLTHEENHLFTFIREPMERLVSVFYFFHHDNEKTRQKRLRSCGKKRQFALLFYVSTQITGGFTADVFWKSMMTNRPLLNHLIKFIPHFDLMTRWLCGKENEVALYDFGDFDNECRRLLSACELPPMPKNGKAPVTHASKHGDVASELSAETQALLRPWLQPDYDLYHKMLSQKQVRLSGKIRNR
jgi:hypothetical protein